MTIMCLHAGSAIPQPALKFLFQKFQQSYNFYLTPLLIQLLPLYRFVYCDFFLRRSMHLLVIRSFSGKTERALIFQISPEHPNEKPPKRDDGYWRAYITRAGESTAMQVCHSSLQVLV